MGGKLKEANRYSLGHFALLIAGERYVAKARDLFKLEPDNVDEKMNLLSAETYLSGVIDMATLYLGVINDESITTHIDHIDKKIEGILDGTYGREDGEGGSPDAG